jgi:acetylglutamate kinase
MSLLVVKVGGAVADAAAGDVLALEAAGHEVCVIHGAGPQISAEMARRGLEVRFVAGRRVTTASAIEAVRDAFGFVNRELCAALGPRAVGLFGDEIGLLAEPVPELGLVGEPLASSPPAVVEALDAGLIPVVAPLAVGPLNVNADDAAAALALGLGADRLVFLTDVAGLLVDGAVVSEIAAGDAENLLDALEGGIVPKVRAAARAARLGLRTEIGATAVTS